MASAWPCPCRNPGDPEWLECPRQTHIENLFGICDAAETQGQLCISQLLEGFVFRHVRILAYLGVQV